VPRRCPDLEIMIEQLPHDPAAQEAGSAEDRNQGAASVLSRGLIHSHVSFCSELDRRSAL
jgi:hypothetical protein